MHKLAPILVPLLVLACGREPAAPGPPQVEATPAPAFHRAATQTEFTAFGEWDFPYPLDCINEGFHMSGHFVIIDRYVTLPNGNAQDLWTVRFEDDWVFVGLSSGDVWDIQPGYNQTGVARFEGPAWAAPVSLYVVHERLSWKNRTDGAVIDTAIRYHLVTNAAGEVTVENLKVGDCRLRP